MIVRHKTCAGWDGISHSAFIWKKIKGVSYCKVCASKIDRLEDLGNRIYKTTKRVEKFIKSIKKISDKQKGKNALKKERTKILHTWFNELWDKLPNDKHCTICDTPIYGENSSIYWDHLLEKSKYPKLELEEKNIILICPDCHTQKTMGNPLPKHRELMEQAKKELL